MIFLKLESSIWKRFENLEKCGRKKKVKFRFLQTKAIKKRGEISCWEHNFPVEFLRKDCLKNQRKLQQQTKTQEMHLQNKLIAHPKKSEQKEKKIDVEKLRSFSLIRWYYSWKVFWWWGDLHWRTCFGKQNAEKSCWVNGFFMRNFRLQSCYLLRCGFISIFTGFLDYLTGDIFVEKIRLFTCLEREQVTNLSKTHSACKSMSVDFF